MLPHFFSRTAAEVDDTCERRRYWNTIFAGIGLEPSQTSEDLMLGTVLHAGVEALWKGGLFAAIVAMEVLPEWPKIGKMWQFWCECIIRAYYRVRYLSMVKTWEVVAVEEEVSYELGLSPKHLRPLILLAKPDLVLRHKLTKMVRYIESKTTRLMDDKFTESWRKAVQLAAGQLGFESKGLIIDQVQIAFWHKGEKTKDGYWRTPYLSAWRTKQVLNKKAMTVVQAAMGPLPIAYAAKRPEKWAGWERFDVWTSGMTPEQWVAKLSDAELAATLPETPELVFDPEIRRRWAFQLKVREGVIADATVDLAEIELSNDTAEQKAALTEWTLDTVFRQKFKQCTPAQGYECPFLALCWNQTIAKDPIGSGLYKLREPHHKTEANALAVEE